MRMLAIVLLALLTLALAACDADGTCLYEDKDPTSEFEGWCVVHSRKSTCNNPGDTFHQEDDTAGLVRCKSGGYTESNAGTAGVEDALKTGAPVTFGRLKKRSK